MTARVLVVDDSDLDRRILTAAVNRLGHEVAAVASGAEALEFLGSAGAGIDIVLLDLVMPGLDGSAVLSRLKADPRLHHLPVIVVSVTDDTLDVARSIELGATDHLTKPIRAPLLAARLSAALAHKQLRDIELDHLKQVGRVIDAAESVQAGDYDLAMLGPVAARPDRLGTLAQVLGRMAREVRDREAELREQVAALRIEIDKSRLQTRVSEVTGSDQYRRLAEQADTLRALITGGEERTSD